MTNEYRMMKNDALFVNTSTGEIGHSFFFHTKMIRFSFNVENTIKFLSIFNIINLIRIIAKQIKVKL